jgi:tetratricopeptide (TPR) repeat protein
MPLASAYREAGDLGRAEELLRENLKRHPGYLSAHVLLGRCLADRGATDEARNEFGYVLSIDPQNLIALRTLGEMAASSGNPDEARRWYGELLAVDPMSVEARQALDALDDAPAAASPAPAQEVAGAWDPFAHGDVASPADAPADVPAFDAPAYGEARLDEPELMDAPGFDDASFESPRLEPAPDLGFGAVDLPVHSDAPAASDAGGDLAQWGDVSLDAPLDLPSDLPAAPRAADAFDFGAVELSDDWSQTPEPAAEPLAADPAAGWGVFDDAAPAAEVAAEPMELRSFHDEEGVGEEEVEMVTETMAELYYRQGFVDRAADVYRELIARRGDEPALVGRLAELDTELNNPVAEELPPLHVAQPADEAVDSSWLSAVDAHVAGAAATAPVAMPLDFADVPREDAFAPAAEADAAPAFTPAAEFDAAPAFRAATGDPFADSFAAGFDGAAEAPAVDAPVSEPAPFAAEPAFDAAPPAFAAEEPRFEEELPAFAAEPSAFEAEPPAFAADEPAVERDAWEAPTVEPTAPVAAFAVDQDAETVRAHERGVDGTESVATYLWSVLSWRPGQTAAPVAYAEPAHEIESYASDAEPAAPALLEYTPSPLEDEAPAAESAFDAPTAAEPFDAPAAAESAYDAPAPFEEPASTESFFEIPAEPNIGAPPPAEAWDDLTLGAPEQQPPLDEPWMADAPSTSEAELLPASEADEPWAIPATPTEELLPADDADSPVDELPWLASEPSVEDFAPAGTEAAGSAADEPMPWEMGLELPAEEAAPAPAPAQPVAGFSFEDFFSEPAATPPPAPEPVPAPAPAPIPEPRVEAAPAPAAETPAGDDDEDLESFQAWLQSLKR